MGIITLIRNTFFSETSTDNNGTQKVSSVDKKNSSANNTAKKEESSKEDKKSEDDKKTKKDTKKKLNLILRETILDTSKYKAVFTDDDIYISIEDIVGLLGGTLQWNSETDRYIVNCLGTHSVIDVKSKKITNARDEMVDISIVGGESDRKVSFYSVMKSFDYDVSKLYSSDYYWARPVNYDKMPVEIAQKFNDKIGIKIENYASKYRRERVEYEAKHPDKKEDYKMREIEGDKVIYLTFDDGPNEYTESILETLNHYDVNGTFFFTGKNIKDNPDMSDLVKKVYSDGNSIGLQGMTGREEVLYSSPEKFLEEMSSEEELIKNIIDVPVKLIRPIYGSYPRMTSAYRETAIENGYRIWDWEADPGDASVSYVEPSDIYEKVMQSVPSEGTLIILMHSRKDNALALPYILESLKENGYTFDIITDDLYPYNFWGDTRTET